jgi:hypothetical protein
MTIIYVFLHIGGKIMQQIWTLRKISLILCLALITFGCATNKGVTETGFSVSATGVPLGIELHFANIPEDTRFMVIGFTNNSINDETGTNVIIISNDDNTLAELKQNGVLLCPFTEKGHDYSINVSIHTESNDDFDKYHANAIAGGGIYRVNNPLLYFTNGNNTLVLSEMPTFSQEVSFSEAALFDYSIYAKRIGERPFPEGALLFGGSGERTNSLSTDSIRQAIITIKEGAAEYYSINFEGDMPIVGVVHCFLNYGNYEWIVGVAQSEEAIVSF